MDLGLYDLDYDKHSLNRRAEQSGEDRSIPENSFDIFVVALQKHFVYD